MPPSIVPMFTVTRCRVSASPAPDNGSEIALALAIAAVTTRRRLERKVLEILQPVERDAQAVDRVGAAVDVRAVRRRARRLDLDPHQALLAEAHDLGRADIAADVGVALGVRDVLQHPAGAERAHVLLVAGERQHDLARPGVAVLGEQSCAASSEQAMPPFMSQTPRP